MAQSQSEQPQKTREKSSGPTEPAEGGESTIDEAIRIQTARDQARDDRPSEEGDKKKAA